MYGKDEQITGHFIWALNPYIICLVTCRYLMHFVHALILKKNEYADIDIDDHDIIWGRSN